MSRDYEEMKSQDRHQDDGRNRHSDRLSSGRPREGPYTGVRHREDCNRAGCREESRPEEQLNKEDTCTEALLEARPEVPHTDATFSEDSHQDKRHKHHHGWHRHAHAENVVRPERFMEPCLLLLLTENVTYGYDLISRLKEFGYGDNQDPGMVYRYLRRLEKRGMIESKWDTSGTGPARRMYKVTPDGNELLAVWTETIRYNIQVLQQFLERYEKAIQGVKTQDELGSTGGGAAPKFVGSAE